MTLPSALFCSVVDGRGRRGRCRQAAWKTCVVERGVLEAQHQPVVGIGWVINAIKVSEEGAKPGTHFEPVMPSAIGTRQARQLQA